jgi:hypothetical protein
MTTWQEGPLTRPLRGHPLPKGERNPSWISAGRQDF